MNDGNPKDPGAGEPAASKPVGNSPAAKSEAGWEMPAPIFRVSEGKPVKKHIAPEITVTEGEIVTPELPADPPPLPPVDTAKNIETPPTGSAKTGQPPKKQSFSFVSLLFTAVGLLGIGLFLIVLTFVIYFVFFYRGTSGGSFN